MPRYLLAHSHESTDCPVAYAAWRGFVSPLRHELATASCSAVDGTSEHRIWWELEASGPKEALAQLPPWVAERTEVNEIGDVTIP